MERKVKFKIVTYRGENRTITRTITFPDYEPIVSKLVITGIPEIDESPISIEDQMIDWLDEWDKTQFMLDNDIGSILDYWIIPEEKCQSLTTVEDQRDTFYVYLDLYRDQASEQVINDLSLSYERMKDSIKTFHPNKQIKIVADAVQLAYAAQSAAYKSISNIHRMEVPSVKEYYAARDRKNLSYEEWAKQKVKLTQ